MGKREKQVKVSPIFVTKIDRAQGIVEAVVNVFGIIDLGGDIVHNGAFAKTINERGNKVKVLDHHNTWSTRDVIGKPLEIREISRDALPQQVKNEFPDATGGLFTRTQFAINETEPAKEVFNLVAGGFVNEYSIGYEAMEFDFDTVKQDGEEIPIRNLREIRLWEYSPVIWGMNQATYTEGVKARSGERFDEPYPVNKEMTPQGPIMRMGDYLNATIHQTFTCVADDLYKHGFLNREERIALSGAIGEALDTFTKTVADNLAQRPVSYDLYDYGWMSANPAHRQDKAGRVLSSRNAQRIVSAVDTLSSVLIDAGIYEAAEDSEGGDITDDGKDEAGPQAGTEAPDVSPPPAPTSTRRETLIEAINQQLTEIETLEV